LDIKELDICVPSSNFYSRILLLASISSAASYPTRVVDSWCGKRGGRSEEGRGDDDQKEERR
jgi:hypothetical protein